MGIKNKTILLIPAFFRINFIRYEKYKIVRQNDVPK